VKNATLAVTIVAGLLALAVGLRTASEWRAAREEAECQPAEHARVRIGGAVYRIPASLQPRLYGLENERAFVREEPRDPKSGSFVRRIRYCVREEVPRARWVNIVSPAAAAVMLRLDPAALRSLARLSLTAFPLADSGTPQSGVRLRRLLKEWRELPIPGLDVNYKCVRSMVPDDEYITCYIKHILEQGSVTLEATIAPATGDEAALRAAAVALDRIVAEWRTEN